LHNITAFIGDDFKQKRTTMQTKLQIRCVNILMKMNIKIT